MFSKKEIDKYRKAFYEKLEVLEDYLKGLIEIITNQ